MLTACPGSQFLVGYPCFGLRLVVRKIHGSHRFGRNDISKWGSVSGSIFFGSVSGRGSGVSGERVVKLRSSKFSSHGC